MCIRDRIEAGPFNNQACRLAAAQRSLDRRIRNLIVRPGRGLRPDARDRQGAGCTCSGYPVARQGLVATALVGTATVSICEAQNSLRELTLLGIGRIGRMRLRCNDAGDPVSYTHLDVYKRQDSEPAPA